MLKNENMKDEKIYCSTNLFQEFNEERRRKGLDEMPEINACPCGNNGTIARKDKSWGSVPAYFIQQFKKAKEEK